MSALPFPGPPGKNRFVNDVWKLGILPGNDRFASARIVPICVPTGASEPAVCENTNSNLLNEPKPKATIEFDEKSN